MKSDMEIGADIDRAMVNSYDFIIGGKTLDDLLDDNPDSLVLMFDPDQYDRVEVIDDMIMYFEDVEEYEKCAVLKNAKKN